MAAVSAQPGAAGNGCTQAGARPQLKEGTSSALSVPAGTAPVRIDTYLAGHGIAPSRAQVQRLIEAQLITVNGAPVRPSYKIQPGDRIMAHIPRAEPLRLEAVDIALPVLYQDEAIAVIDKPAGLVTHPAPGNWERTLVHALLHHLTGLSGIGGRERPGIVHRLDKDTSGVMVVAKNDQAHAHLSAQFKAHQLDRRYHAIVAGHPPAAQGMVNLPIGRDRKNRKKISSDTDHPRRAVTHYRTLERLSGATWLELKLETGRTHQIRVHLAHLGCPVLGDRVYGGARAIIRGIPVPRQMLHASRIAIVHPVSGERMRFESPPPEDFQKVLEWLRERP